MFEKHILNSPTWTTTSCTPELRWNPQVFKLYRRKKEIALYSVLLVCRRRQNWARYTCVTDRDELPAFQTREKDDNVATRRRRMRWILFYLAMTHCLKMEAENWKPRRVSSETIFSSWSLKTFIRHVGIKEVPTKWWNNICLNTVKYAKFSQLNINREITIIPTVIVIN